MLPTSYHPLHICESIPYSVLSRVKRCCSVPEDFLKALEDYKGYLKDRGYSDRTINKAEMKLAKVSRGQLRKVESADVDEAEIKRPKKDFRCFPLVMKYNVKLPKMNQLIKKYQHILEWSPETTQLFPKGSVFVSYKVEPTIRQLLCKSAFPLLTNDSPCRIDAEIAPTISGGCFKCGNKCKLCDLFLTEGEYAWSFNTHDKFKIKSKLNCGSGNVIYIIFDLYYP